MISLVFIKKPRKSCQNHCFYKVPCFSWHLQKALNLIKTMVLAPFAFFFDQNQWNHAFSQGKKQTFAYEKDVKPYKNNGFGIRNHDFFDLCDFLIFLEPRRQVMWWTSIAGSHSQQPWQWNSGEGSVRCRNGLLLTHFFKFGRQHVKRKTQQMKCPGEVGFGRHTSHLYIFIYIYIYIYIYMNNYI